MPSDFGPSLRQRRENAQVPGPELAAVIHMTWQRLEAIETRQLEATDAQKQALLLALARLEAKPHPPDCLCLTCERTGGGQLAVRAFMAGDDSAAARLSLAVVAALSAQRDKTRRRTSPHSTTRRLDVSQGAS